MEHKNNQLVGVGIIGTGSIAVAAHMPAVTSSGSTKLVAVLSRQQATGAKFLAKDSLHDAQVYTQLKAFVSDPAIHLVIICSPDQLHYQQAVACIKAGKHVLLEKPLTITVSEAQELLKLAKQYNTTLATGFHLRSHAGLRLLQTRVANGAIGKLRHVRVVWAFPQADNTNWRAHSQLTKWWSLSAVGSHCIDLARWFANDSEDWAQLNVTLANNLWHGPHDETAIVSGQLKTGTTVEVTSSIQFGPYNSVELFGSSGYAVCNDTLGRDGGGSIVINEQKLAFEQQNPYVTQLQNVVSHINSELTLNADANMGLRSVKDLTLCQAVHPLNQPRLLK